MASSPPSGGAGGLREEPDKPVTDFHVQLFCAAAFMSCRAVASGACLHPTWRQESQK